jgi:hypothetical protein
MTRFLPCLTSTLILLSSAATVFCQDTISLKKERLQGTVITDRPPQAIYSEFGGSGLFLSMNYDTRLSKRVDGPGLRAGLGYSFSSAPSIISVPLVFNYLLGRNGNYFEMGAGGTYVNMIDNNGYHYISFANADFTPDRTNLFFGTLNFGYRRQPVRGGFNFRVGLSPVFGEGAAGLTGYLSLGYNF